MKIDDLKKEWRKDSEIDLTDFTGELLKISKLHSKYMNFLLDERRKFKQYEIEYDRIKKVKREYYLGRLPRKFIESQNWDPIEHEIRPSDVGDYLKGDKDLCDVYGQLGLIEIKIDFLKEIIKAIHNRGLNIRTCVDWQKFCQGER